MRRNLYTTLRVPRLARGLAQEQLAACTGLSQQQISRLETGRRRGRPETWRRIARVLGVPVQAVRGTPEGRRER
jgi:transcriptional regulator with XRE-family HTH domain